MTFGRYPARIQSVALTPGAVGVGQASVIVPVIPASDYPVILTLGNSASNWAIVSVGGPAQ